MNPRLQDLPIYEFRRSQVDAVYYNLAQVALNRIGPSQCYPIPKLKNLALIIEKDAWIIIDRSLNEMPVAAWLNFKTIHRQSLHEAVDCHLRLYHAHADLILQQTLEAMQQLLGEKLHEPETDTGANVLPFHHAKITDKT
ncbi:MAG: hypothetical protein GXP08_18265 [Gammaproteobacteria bacterium]|nr:hypothetical protein [Gammaproteobacteria bacterium]